MYGYIYKTKDGGHHWLLLKRMKGVFPNAIAFVNPHLAYVSAYVPINVNYPLFKGNRVSWHLTFSLVLGMIAVGTNVLLLRSVNLIEYGGIKYVHNNRRLC